MPPGDDEQNVDSRPTHGASPEMAPAALPSSSAEPQSPLATDWWRVSPRETAPQWSLVELFLLTTGAAVTAAVSRLMSPIGLAAVLGVVVIAGWLRLQLDDWEPRWAVVAWRCVLVAYLTSSLIAVLRP